MPETRDPSTNDELFTEKAFEFFELNGIPEFTTPEEALTLIQSADDIIEFFIQKLGEEGIPVNDELILQLGSTVGTAFMVLFKGRWLFSEAQGRWVVEFVTPKGSNMEVNVFHKIEKRFQNGDEDSISFYFDGIKNLYLQEAAEVEETKLE